MIIDVLSSEWAWRIGFMVAGGGIVFVLLCCLYLARSGDAVAEYVTLLNRAKQAEADAKYWEGVAAVRETIIELDAVLIASWKKSATSARSERDEYAAELARRESA